MAERYTLRNRRVPGLRAAGAERAVKSRFAMDTIEAAPATPPAPVWPFREPRPRIHRISGPVGRRRGRLTTGLLERQAQARHTGTSRASVLFRGTDLAGTLGCQRSGLRDHPVHELGQDKYHGYNLTHGLKALLCLRAIKPSVSGFRANKFNQYPYAF